MKTAIEAATPASATSRTMKQPHALSCYSIVSMCFRLFMELVELFI